MFLSALAEGERLTLSPQTELNKSLGGFKPLRPEWSMGEGFWYHLIDNFKVTSSLPV